MKENRWTRTRRSLYKLPGKRSSREIIRSDRRSGPDPYVLLRDVFLVLVQYFIQMFKSFTFYNCTFQGDIMYRALYTINLLRRAVDLNKQDITFRIYIRRRIHHEERILPGMAQYKHYLGLY